MELLILGVCNVVSKLEGVIFDLDGVITDTAEYHYLAWKQLAEDLGISFDRDFNEKLKGISRMESLNIILKAGNKSLTDEEKEELAAKKNEHYKTFIQKITPNDLLPGIEGFMRDIKEAGIKTGLASASKNAMAVVGRLEIGHLLDTIVDAAKVEKGKPDPEVFLKAAQQLLVDPSNCVGVEDAEAGVQAIKAAGMYAVGVGSKEAMEEADWIIRNSNELSLDKLTELFNKH